MRLIFDQGAVAVKFARYYSRSKNAISRSEWIGKESIRRIPNIVDEKIDRAAAACFKRDQCGKKQRGQFCLICHLLYIWKQEKKIRMRKWHSEIWPRDSLNGLQKNLNNSAHYPIIITMKGEYWALGKNNGGRNRNSSQISPGDGYTRAVFRNRLSPVLNTQDTHSSQPDTPRNLPPSSISCSDHKLICHNDPICSLLGVVPSPLLRRIW